MKAVETYYDFQWRSLVETANTLSKGMTFYIAILASVTSYIFTKQIGQDQLRFLITIGLIVSIFFGTAASSVAWGFYTGLKDLEGSLRELSPREFSNLNLPAFFSRGRLVFWITIISIFLILIAFLVAMVMFYYDGIA